MEWLVFVLGGLYVIVGVVLGAVLVTAATREKDK